MEHGGILYYMFARTEDDNDVSGASYSETAVHVLREIIPECVLNLVRGLYPNPPDTPYLGHKWW